MPLNKIGSLKSELLEKIDVPATILLATLLNEFGLDLMEWEPETIEMEVKDTFGIDLPSNNLDKVMALISAITREHFYKDYKVFEGIVKALNDDDPAPDRIVEATPEEIAWAIHEVLDADETPEEWDEDVKAYIREVYKDYGYLTVPEELKFVNYIPGVIDPAMPDTLKEKVENEQRIKLLRIKMYIADRKRLMEKYHEYIK